MEAWRHYIVTHIPRGVASVKKEFTGTLRRDSAVRRACKDSMASTMHDSFEDNLVTQRLFTTWHACLGNTPKAERTPRRREGV